MDRPIPYGRQDITETDIRAVMEILTSDLITQGPTIAKFEEAFAKYVGSKFAVAVANGTAALHLSTLALGVGPGQKIITSPITFVASANCVGYCGGQVVFSDIDPETYLLNIDGVKHLLAESPAGTFTGIIPVDFAGRAVDMEKLRPIADKYKLWILEDACHAPGGYFVDRTGKQQNCGNCNFSDLAIFSFHPVKRITTGEGGMITTNREDLYKKLVRLRTHGITRDTSMFQNTTHLANGGNATGEYPGWYMEMVELGFNYRLTDFQSALGLTQLKRADEGVARRRKIASLYESSLSGKTFIKRQSGVVEGHAYHLYVIEVEDRLGLYKHLRHKNIYTQVHYIPCHLMPYYQQFGWRNGDLPFAENYYSACLSLPVYPALSDNEVDYIIDTIIKYYS